MSLRFRSNLRSQFESIVGATVPASAGVLLAGLVLAALVLLPVGLAGLVKRISTVGGCGPPVEQGTDTVGQRLVRSTCRIVVGGDSPLVVGEDLAKKVSSFAAIAAGRPMDVIGFSVAVFVDFSAAF